MAIWQIWQVLEHYDSDHLLIDTKEKYVNAQETYLHDVEIGTNKPKFRHTNMGIDRDISIGVYKHWVFCVIYGFVGFMFSGKGGLG